MGRNKIIYGLCRCTIVVATDLDTGGTWAGATEALKNQFGASLRGTEPGPARAMVRLLSTEPSN